MRLKTSARPLDNEVFVTVQAPPSPSPIEDVEFQQDIPYNDNIETPSLKKPKMT